MKNWNIYLQANSNVETQNIIVKHIINEIGFCLNNFFGFYTKKRPRRTTLIMDTLTILGDKELKDKPSYKVYSHSLSDNLKQANGGKYKNKEFLYDLHWYTESTEPYTPTGIPLVVECEWNHKKKGDSKIAYSGIKYDFQKLLASNAELRLMIFVIEKDDDLDKIDTYFESAISAYTHLAPASKFLFVAFDEKIKGFYYTEKQKNYEAL